MNEALIFPATEGEVSIQFVDGGALRLVALVRENRSEIVIVLSPGHVAELLSYLVKHK